MKLSAICKLLFALTIMALLIKPAIACDERCKKASSRAVKAYGNKVVKAEESSCKVDLIRPRKIKIIAKSCQKAVRYLDVRYDGYSVLVKSNPKIKEIRERHLELHNTLSRIETLATAEAIKKMSSSKSKKILDGFF
jgi:hypothetical protein